MCLPRDLQPCLAATCPCLNVNGSPRGMTAVRVSARSHVTSGGHHQRCPGSCAVVLVIGMKGMNQSWRIFERASQAANGRQDRVLSMVDSRDSRQILPALEPRADPSPPTSAQQRRSCPNGLCRDDLPSSLPANRRRPISLIGKETTDRSFPAAATALH